MQTDGSPFSTNRLPAGLTSKPGATGTVFPLMPILTGNASSRMHMSCLGYTLYHQLTNAGFKCVLLAPTTRLTQQGQHVKTDKRDAYLIAECLCYGGYHSVYIHTEENDSVKEYLRMRDDHKLALKN